MRGILYVAVMFSEPPDQLSQLDTQSRSQRLTRT